MTNSIPQRGTTFTPQTRMDTGFLGFAFEKYRQKYRQKQCRVD